MHEFECYKIDVVTVQANFDLNSPILGFAADEMMLVGKFEIDVVVLIFIRRFVLGVTQIKAAFNVSRRLIDIEIWVIQLRILMTVKQLTFALIRDCNF